MPSSRTSSARNIAKIKRVLTILDGHVGQRHALDELAAMAGLSRWYFSRTFHAVAGMPLRDYLRAVKLKRALELVRASTRSLTDIAKCCGFGGTSQFSRAFRARFGMPPRQYLALVRQQDLDWHEARLIADGFDPDAFLWRQEGLS